MGSSDVSCSVQISFDSRNDYGGLIIMRSKEYACIIVACFNKHASNPLTEIFNQGKYETLSLSINENGILTITKTGDLHSNEYYITVIS